MNIKITVYLPNSPRPIHTSYFKNVDDAMREEQLLNRRGFQVFVEMV